MRRPPPAPPNPFHAIHRAPDPHIAPAGPQRLRWIDESSRSILVENTSPDLPFRWGLNPYRGCSHACAYCYARRTHEYLDLDAGEDFERVILVKRDAAALLREALRRPGWVGEPINLSGVTDPYQPLERRLGITRACLTVMVEAQQPVRIVTRSPLVLRDLDLLSALAVHGAARVMVSIPIQDPALARALEPGAPGPEARWQAVEQLVAAGIPVGVSLAPLLPKLTEHEVAGAIHRAATARVSWVWTGLLRLPGSVAAVFADRLQIARPGQADAVLARLSSWRDGALGGRGLGHRMGSDDPRWRTLQAIADASRRHHGLASEEPPWPDPTPFQRPPPLDDPRQPTLF